MRSSPNVTQSGHSCADPFRFMWGRRVETLRRFLNTRTDECLLWPHTLDRDGYAGPVQVAGTMYKAYLLSCEYQAGKRPSSKLQAAHSCGTRSCVNPRHLRWATARQNAADKKLHGTEIYGERQGAHKLTDAAVQAIRQRASRGEQLQALAREFGVSPSNITLIVQRKTWAHVC